MFTPAPLGPKYPNLALHKYSFFCLKHIVPVIIDAFVLQTFYSTWIQGVAYQKQLLGPKLTGVWAREHPKMWEPLLFSATVEASNFKFGIQLKFGE